MSLRVIDFAQPRERLPRLGVMLLVLGVLAMLMMAVCQQSWDAERDEAARSAERRAEALRLQLEQRPAMVMPSVDERRMQRVIAERGRPWLPVLRAIESATRDPVSLLTMSADTSNHSLRLEAEALSFEQVLAYVQVLPDGKGLVSAQLMSHEVVTDAVSGRQVVRFSVSARWRSP